MSTDPTATVVPAPAPATDASSPQTRRGRFAPNPTMRRYLAAFRSPRGVIGAVILLDAAPRGEAPGTLSVIAPELDDDDRLVPDGHAMDPVHVLRLARRLGGLPSYVRLVACEPATVTPLTDDQIGMALSTAVQDALDGAVALVEGLIEELLGDGKEAGA